MTGIPDLPDLWIISELGDQLTRSDERIDPARKPNEKYLCVGLENIESDTGHLMEAPEVFGSEIKSTKNIFKPGDILYGKLRPYLNKVHLAETNGICSTDLWVLRPASTIHPVYAAHYLRSAHVLQRVSQLATGANLPRVSVAAFDVIPVPLSPLSEQSRIAAILQQADELRRMRREANERASNLLSSIFVEMFGDPKSNPRAWISGKLDSLCEIKGGKRLPKGESYSLIPTPFRYIRVTDIINGQVNESELVYLRPDTQARISRYTVDEGDVIISIAGTTGLVAPIPASLAGANLTENAAKLVSRKQGQYDPVYLAQYLRTSYAQEQIRAQTKQVTIGKLALFRIEQLTVLLPPLSLQQEFALRVAEIRAVEVKQSNGQKQSDELFQALVAQAFTGELTAVWREANRAELTQAAEEMRQRLEEKKRPVEPVSIQITTDEALKQSLAKFNLVAKALAQRIREAVDEFFARHTGEAFNIALTPTMVPQFFHLADILKPYTNSLAESLNEGLRQQISEIRYPDTNILAFGLIPLAESLRQQSQLYYADLLLKMSQLTRLQLGESPTRAELQEAIGQVIEQLPQYWTLVDLAEDWRVNHLPRNTVREIVDMLVVMGQLRETTIRHETEDRQQPVQLIKAYTRVLDSERVTAAEIQL